MNQKELMAYEFNKPINYIVCELFNPKKHTTASENIYVELKQNGQIPLSFETSRLQHPHIVIFI